MTFDPSGFFRIASELALNANSRVLKNPFDHPPVPLPGQEGGGN
jgi:hypothetical protein